MNTQKATECTCLDCGKQAKGFLPRYGNESPSYPYCRRCLRRKKRLIKKMMKKHGKQTTTNATPMHSLSPHPLQSTAELIQQACVECGYNFQQLINPNKRRDLCTIRQLFWLELHNHGLPLNQMSAVFARDKSTISVGIKRVEYLLHIGDPYATQQCTRIANTLTPKLPL